MKSTEETKKYREMPVDKLSLELVEIRRNLAHAELKVQAGKLDKYSDLEKLRKSVARISTIISEKSAE